MRDVRLKAAQLLAGAGTLHREGHLKDAEAGYRRVLAMDPANADALNMLGLIAHTRGDGETALYLMRASINLRPHADAWYNLGTVLEARSEVPACLAAFRQAALLSPTSVENWSTAIYVGDLHPFSSPAIRLADRRSFNDVHCAALTAAAEPHTNTPDPERKLRVGYLSADFFDHSAVMAFGPVIEGHDRANVEVYLYWQQRTKADAHTERFKRLADHWQVVNTLSDEELAEQIRADGIDILIDLAGYSNAHRLLVLARKPAPIIMTGWGHVTGIGLDASDYILADDVTVPEGAEWQHHERILRLPCLMAFDPRPPYPDVAAPPVERNGTVTFGYVGRATKMSESVWAVWATILHRVPGSRLLLKGREYADVGYRQRIVEFFASLRIGSNRLVFRGVTNRAQHLDAYADIDVALDVWPQTSGITMLEACLMGVPTVSLLGDHLNGRIGASILATLGRQQWVGLSTEHYVEIAVALSLGQQTRETRAALRADLLDSVICKPSEYAAAVEALYRQAWGEWCANRVEQPQRELVAAGGHS